jgi:nitrogen-specific signal transduction histidine kinase
MLARILRHEVGDLLQTVYAAAAILQERLPVEATMERRVVGDLRGRAEVCKHLLDAVHDWVCPMTLSPEALDLNELVVPLAAKTAARHARIKVQAEAAPGLPAVLGDSRRLLQMGYLVLETFSEAARERVESQLAADAGGGVAWTVTHDGPASPGDQPERLFSPFPAGRYHAVGLALALAQKVVQLHAGQISAANRPEGGVGVRIVLPAARGT